MDQQRDWTVEVRVSYSVEAPSADQALSAVLPLLSLGRERYGPQPEIADYTVRERPVRQAGPGVSAGNKVADGLLKPVYTAQEVAQLLGVGKATVYQKVPSIRIGGTVRFARATLQQIIEHGLDEKPSEVPKPVTRSYRSRQSDPPARVKPVKEEKAEKPLLSIKEVARILRIAPTKVRQLIDNKLIFHRNQFGRITLYRDAIEYYAAGKSARWVVEERIRYQAEKDPARAATEEFQKLAQQLRDEFPE